MHADVTHWQADQQRQRTELLTVEEPLELRIENTPLAVIMRTPGHDRELACGFLLTEGIIQQATDVLQIETALDADGLPEANVLNITLRPELACATPATQGSFQRHFAVSSSCGLCGKNSIADLLQTTATLPPDELHIPSSTLYRLDEQMRTQQTIFGHTGGLHAAALFTQAGELLLLREDVGRHNAVDKLIGHGMLQGGFPYQEYILLVSGRTSFEIIQKALIARIPCVVAISAPSSLAVDLAERAGMTLAGFLRGASMNVYTHPQRISTI
jgi:FdhD protein